MMPTMNLDPCLTRRGFLRSAGSAAAGLMVSAASPGQAPPESYLVIDCHAHIYGEDETKYPTIESPRRPPAGKGTIAHLQREMKAADVRHVTAVQTSSYYRWDNRFTMDASRAHKNFMVGICTLNPDDPGSPDLLETYVKHYNARGMRSIPGQSGRFDDPGVEALWDKAGELGVVVNVLTRGEKQREVEALAQRHPGLRIVIDHCLYPKAGPTLEPTLKAVTALAGLPNTHAKLSFVPGGSNEAFPFRDMHEACHRIINAFGADRCVWGSGFPCELWCPKSTYQKNLQVFTHEMGLDEDTKKKVLGKTAFGLWFQGRG